MSWSRRPRGTQDKYRSREHRNERARLIAELARVGSTQCAQPECVMPSRLILPGDPVALGHDATGRWYIGLVHKRCNDRDGAKRGNRRSRRLRANRDPAGGRWAL